MTYVLYVSKQRETLCRGSRECVKLLRQLPLQVVTLQSTCRVLRRQQALPSWLNGTPILVRRVDNRIFKGRHAIAELNRMAADESDIDEISLEPDAPEEPGRFHDLENEEHRDTRSEADVFGTIQAAEVLANVNTGKITEQDLQRAIDERERNIPKAQPTTASLPPPVSSKD